MRSVIQKLSLHGAAKLLFLCFLLSLSSCAGLAARHHLETSASPGDLSPRCQSLLTQYEVWGAIAAGSVAIGSSSALGGIFDPSNQTDRRILAAVGLSTMLTGGVAIWLRDVVTGDFQQECNATPPAGVSAETETLSPPKEKVRACQQGSPLLPGAKPGGALPACDQKSR